MISHHLDQLFFSEERAGLFIAETLDQIEYLGDLFRILFLRLLEILNVCSHLSDGGRLEYVPHE